MSDMRNDERLLDLLAARATEGLDASETAELERLLAQAPGADDDDFDLAAAAADLAMSSLTAESESMPEHVGRRIAADATRHLSAGPSSSSTEQPGAGVAQFPDRSRSRTAMLGWLAAAAMFLVALLGWMRTVPPETLDTTQVRTAAEQYQDFVESRTDILQVAWAPSADPEFVGVAGDVVWSNEAQAGFMRLRGMPANDPAARQYQLWIVDPARDAEPVDGGVFDIPAGEAEVFVPIDAKLAVTSPAAFAITVEQPGGVVVSEGPLRVVAPVTGSAA